MQPFEDCPLDCYLAETTPIQDLPGQFGACAQQCETSLLSKEQNLILLVCVGCPRSVLFT